MSNLSAEEPFLKEESKVRSIDKDGHSTLTQRLVVQYLLINLHIDVASLLDPIQPLDFRLEHTFNNEIGGYLPDKDDDGITCGKSESSTVLNRVLPSYSIYMPHYVLSQAEVKVEGEPIAPEQSVHNLVNGMDAHVESREADQEGQRESDIEPESVTKLPRRFSDLFFVLIFLMKDVQEHKTVEGCRED